MARLAPSAAKAAKAAAAPSPWAEHCLELFEPLGAVQCKRMFGGWGFYLDGLFFALIAYERLFMKVDDATRPRFAAAGSEAFVYRSKNREQASLGYLSAPADAMESPALMAPWARLAVQAALTARGARVAKTAAKTVPAAARKSKRQPAIKTPAAPTPAASPAAPPSRPSPSKPRRRV